MKKIILPACFLFAFNLYSQITPEWITKNATLLTSSTYDGSLATLDGDGFCFLAGTKTIGGAEVGVVLKVDPDGNPVAEWVVEEDWVPRVKVAADGDLLVYHDRTIPGLGVQAHLQKLSPDGVVMNTWTFTPPFVGAISYQRDLLPYPNGDVYSIVSGSDSKLRIIRFNSHLDEIWQHELSSVSSGSPSGYFASAGPNGVLLFYYDASMIYPTYTAVRIDSLGNELWSLPLGYGLAHPTAIGLPDGDFLLGGAEAFNDSTYVARLGSSGTIEWLTTLNEDTTNASMSGFAVDGSQQVYVCFTAFGTTTRPQTTKLRPDGTVAWTRDLPTDGMDSPMLQCPPVLVGDHLAIAYMRNTCAGMGSVSQNNMVFAALDTLDGLTVDSLELAHPCEAMGAITTLLKTPDDKVEFVGVMIPSLVSDYADFMIGKLCMTGCLPGEATYQGVSGTVFVDDDGDCLPDAGELRVPGHLVTITPGPFYAMTDSLGQYALSLPLGTYTVSTPPVVYRTHSCTTGSVNVTLDVASPAAMVQFGLEEAPAQDLEAFMFTSAMRPGFDGQVTATVKNWGTSAVTGAFRVQVDTTLTVLGSDPPADTVSGHTLAWSLTSLPALAASTFRVQVNVPTSVPLGTGLGFGATAMPVAGDITPVNNVVSHTRVVTGSFDPNDKAVTPADSLTAKDSVLTYVIQFQNLGTDTAFNVWVRDTLDADFVLGSLSMVSASHAYTLEVTDGNCVVWRFEGIRLPAASTDEPGSHGHVQYTLKRKPGASTSTTYANRADIFFDFNPAVSTNTVVSHLEMGVWAEGPETWMEVKCQPVPVADLLHVEWPADGQTEILLWDMRGNVVQRTTAVGKEATLELAALPPALYVVDVRQGANRAVRKVVKL